MSAGLTPDEQARLEQRRRAGSLGGLTGSSNLTPEQRTARARKAGLASQAKRRAEREAAGLAPLPPRRREPLPTAEELEPHLAEIDAEPRDVPLTYEERYREALLRQRLHVARLTAEAFKREAGA